MLEPNAYWTGYFTSRPSLKLHERRSNAMLIAAKQAMAMAGRWGYERLGITRNPFMKHMAPAILSPGPTAPLQLAQLQVLQREVGVAQHHDAVTGTCTAEVDSDYHWRLR